MQIISLMYWKKQYTITTDWQGCNYYRLRIGWHYKDNFVDISIPNYIKSLLHKVFHPTIRIAQHSPHPYNHPVYSHGPPKAKVNILYHQYWKKQTQNMPNEAQEAACIIPVHQMHHTPHTDQNPICLGKTNQKHVGKTSSTSRLSSSIPRQKNWISCQQNDTYNRLQCRLPLST